MIGETATTRIIMNEHGLLAEVPQDGHDTIPHYIKATIVTPDDWKRVKEERFRRDDPARKVDVAAAQAAHPRDRDYPLGVHCGSMIGKIRDMLTFEGLAYAIYDYPEMVEDMVETACVLVEDFLDQVLGHIDFDYASGWEDICFKNGPIVSVSFFQRRRRAALQAHRREAAGRRHRPVVHRLRRRRAPDPARTSWRAASTACSPSRSTAAPTRASCSTGTARSCASWAAWTR